MNHKGIFQEHLMALDYNPKQIIYETLGQLNEVTNTMQWECKLFLKGKVYTTVHCTGTKKDAEQLAAKQAMQKFQTDVLPNFSDEAFREDDSHQGANNSSLQNQLIQIEKQNVELKLMLKRAMLDATYNLKLTSALVLTLTGNGSVTEKQTLLQTINELNTEYSTKVTQLSAEK